MDITIFYTWVLTSIYIDSLSFACYMFVFKISEGAFRFLWGDMSMFTQVSNLARVNIFLANYSLIDL